MKNDKSTRKSILGTLNDIFCQRYPVYHQKSDAVRFERTMLDPTPKFISPPSVRKWRETANENLEKIKSEIEQIPSHVENDDVFESKLNTKEQFSQERPSSGYQMPDLSNPDEVALHIAKLVSENHALKNARSSSSFGWLEYWVYILCSLKIFGHLYLSPVIKRSHSFQPTKIDELRGFNQHFCITWVKV